MSERDPNADKRYKSKDGRYMSKEKESTVVGGIIKVGVGATALAGAAAVAYRTGAVGKVARVADVEGRAFARAFKRTRSERDLKVSRFSEKTIDSFENNFLQERRKILNDRKQGKRAQEYTVQKELRRSREYVYGAEDRPSGLADALDDSFRAKLVLQDVKKSADQDLINHFNKIKSSMNSFTTRNLRNVTDYQMAQAMKKQGIESEDVIQKFNQIRNKYGERNLIHTNDEAALAYERLSSKVEKEAIHQIVQNQKKDRTLGRVIRGKKRATVDDMLALHKEGLHKLDEATKLNLEKAKEINSGFGDVVYDRHLFINKKGKLEDYSVFKEMSRANLDYWSRSMPGGIFHIRNYLNVKEAEEGITIRTINRGTVQSAINPYLGKSSTESLDDHYLYIQGKVYDIFNNKTINSDQALQHFNTKRDVLLTSSRFGSLPRMYRGMAGTLSPKEDRGLFARAFDLGRQDTDSLYGRAKSFFMKFGDENWGRNVGLESLKHGAADIDDYKMLKKMTEEASYKGIDSRTVDVLKPHLSQDIQELMSDRIFSFSSKKDIEELFHKIGKIETSNTVRGGNEEFIRVYREYMKSPDDFMMRVKTVGELDPFFKTPTNQVTGEDMLRQQVSSYLLENAATNLMHKQMRGTALENKISGYQELRNLLYQSTFSKDISKSEYKEALKSIDYAQISEMNIGGRLARDYAPVYNFNKTAEVDDMFVESMADTVRKNHTFFETYNMTPYENLIKDDYILIGKTHFGDSASAIFGLNSSISDRFYGFSNITSQIFARREKMEDTTLFTIGQFYTGYRLQEMLSQIGLGMSDASMKSTWSMYSNLFTKRVFPAYAGYEGFKYLDWKMDEYTGRGFTERYEDMKAEDRLHTAFEMTNQDRYEVLKQQQLRPGIEHFEAMPSFFMPGIGTVNPMGEFANLTTSMVTGTQTSSYDSKLSYTVEETYDDLFYGTEEVRKSRWWSAGSKSAYRGDRITEFAPNSWRLAHSDWEYSGVGLTAEEYWSHSMLPTLENPLGGLSFALGLRDPYYFEKKHYHDRPYMLTGELFNTGTPILGDFGNATIGRLIKPVEQMHPDYWDGTAEIQEVRGLEYYKELAEINTSFVSGKPPTFYQDIPGYALESGRELMLEEIESTTQRKPNLIERMMDEGSYVNAADLSQQRLITQLEGPPEAFIPSGRSIPLMEGSASYLGVLENPSIANYQSDYTASLLESGQEPELNYVYNYKTEDYDYVGGAPQGNILFQNKVEVPYTYEEKYANEDFYDNMLLENVIDPRSKEWRNQEFFENITEPLGVYKWMVGSELLGIENYQGKMVIDTAASAYDASGEFWASNLGSLGGAYSEMARRFIRRESGQLEHYNPIRNTMPDWLPGEDYFTNFLEGDPYCVSPDTLIEVNGSELIEAKNVKAGDIIKTHKGMLRPVEAVKERSIRKDEKVYKFTVASLPSLPFTVSEKHPILSVKDHANRRNYGQLKYVKLYEQSNKIMDLLFENGPMKKKDIQEKTGIHTSRITLIVQYLVSEGIVKDGGRRKNVELLKYKPYDVELIKRGVSWIEAKDIEVGDYVAYPLPENIEEKVVLDMADYIDSDKYTITEENVRYGCGSNQFNEIVEYLNKNGVPEFKWGERKKFLEERAWDPRVYESAQASIRYGYNGFVFPRFVEINEEVAAMFGYWVAEGSANENYVSWAFHEKEQKYRDEISQCLIGLIGRDGGTYASCGDSKGVNYIIGCKPLGELLSSLFGNGARNKHLPDWFINMPNNVLISFIRALLNGDGYEFETDRRRVGLKTTSLRLAYQVRLILLKLGILSNVVKNNPQETTLKNGQVVKGGISYSVNANGQAAKKLSDLIGYSIEGDTDGKGTTYYMDDMYVYLRVNKKETFNREDIPTVIGFQVGVDDSFCVAGVATHNTKIEHGERRLPGAGYESLNELHPDEFGMYGAFDRFKILSDVAPWSDEYNFWSDYVQEYETDEDLRKQADVIRKQASKIKQRFDFQPYRFKDNNVQYESVTVDKVLDDYTFLTKEFGTTPIRLAGLTYVNTDTGMLSSMIESGDKVTIGIEGDPDRRIQDDTYGSMKAVLKTNLRNINQMIIEAGMAKEDMNDFSAPGIHARFTEEELAQGSRWETLAHAPTVINTKFLPVRTALEEYQRDQIYGRDWATWEDFMFRDYLIPSLEGVGRYNNPLVAVGFGATTGYVASWFLMPKGKGRIFATAAGGAVGMTGFIADEFSKSTTGRSDIPLRRHQENLINEYYDFLEYLKYSALYDKGVEEYKKKYGVDISEMIEESEEEAIEIKEKIDGAQKLKKWYYTNQPENYEEKITIYNQVEEVLRDSLKENNVADNAEMAQVLYYRERRDQTVYGIDPLTASREDIMKALPHKDAYFFNEFADATNKEKRRIMQIIPESHRRIYKAVWEGEEIESPSLDQMARRFSIPDAHWDGWKPEYNLEDIKVKTVNENDNLDLTDFGFWEDDVYRGQFAPELNPRGGNVIHKSRGDVKNEIRGVLRGAGLDKIDVLVTETGGRGTNMNLDYKMDRSQEIEDKFRRDISDFM